MKSYCDKLLQLIMINDSKFFKLPDYLRDKLREPFGTVIKSDDVVKEQLNGRDIIAVGDSTILKLIDLGFNCSMVVFDFKTMRKELDEKSKEMLNNKFKNQFVFENPPGMLNKSLIKFLINQFHDKKTISNYEPIVIRIIGEEDLVALPIMVLMQEHQLLCYGQPNEGIVVVIPTKEIKNTCLNYLKKFDNVDL
ncbi:MAG: DUF359 domain-containing protein [Candidatus Micrarchaeota archaeon]|nr:DUF359 domain-containing protein [Candidatus Micrarchaeota archaeon]